MQGGKAVAVKLFKGEVSPDGRAVDEIDVTCAVDHANLTRCACTGQRTGLTPNVIAEGPKGTHRVIQALETRTCLQGCVSRCHRVCYSHGCALYA